MDSIGKGMVLWYLHHQRDLPWRHTKDPYLIWISEIILQQTQIVTGLGYYLRITQRFPNVQALANAHEDELMKLWQGLGYYSRARNMHQAAKQIVVNHNGQFPRTHDAIKNLKGIGPYTAAAVASIAYGLPHAVVDGNVYRVLSRLFAIDTPIDSTEGKKQFHKLAQQLLDHTQPGIHNQAIMELGALVCRPVNPDCTQCPVALYCTAKQTNTQAQFPVKSKKVQVRTRFLHYILCETPNGLFVGQRKGNDIWHNLYELPLWETPAETDQQTVVNKAVEIVGAATPHSIASINHQRHILTHQVLMMTFVHIKMTSDNATIPNFQWTSFDQLHRLAFPKPIERYLATKLHV